MDFELVPGRLIGPTHPVFIIAEIGQNHQGNLETAKEMIMKAKQCGADCVKFQKSCLKEKFTKNALERAYHSENSFGSTYGEHKAYLEFSDEEFEILKDFCQNEVKIAMTASAMDDLSVDFLVNLGVPFIKIGSGDSNNMILLQKVAKIIDMVAVISTGMSEISQVQQIYDIFKGSREKSQQLCHFAMYKCIPNRMQRCKLKST